MDHAEREEEALAHIDVCCCAAAGTEQYLLSVCLGPRVSPPIAHSTARLDLGTLLPTFSSASKPAPLLNVHSRNVHCFLPRVHTEGGYGVVGVVQQIYTHCPNFTLALQRLSGSLRCSGHQSPSARNIGSTTDLRQHNASARLKRRGTGEVPRAPTAPYSTKVHTTVAILADPLHRRRFQDGARTPPPMSDCAVTRQRHVHDADTAVE